MPSNTARSITSKEMLLAWAIIQRCYSMSCALLKQVVNRFAHESCCEACNESCQSSSISLILRHIILLRSANLVLSSLYIGWLQAPDELRPRGSGWGLSTARTRAAVRQRQAECQASR